MARVVEDRFAIARRQCEAGGGRHYLVVWIALRAVHSGKTGNCLE